MGNDPFVLKWTIILFVMYAIGYTLWTLTKEVENDKSVVGREINIGESSINIADRSDEYVGVLAKRRKERIRNSRKLARTITCSGTVNKRKQ